MFAGVDGFCGKSSSVSLSSKTRVSGNVNLFTAHAQYVKKILSPDMWMFSEHCSPECGSYEAPGAEFWLVWLVKRHHP